MLEGRKFILFTDHNTLTQSLFRTSDPETPRQCRQLSYITEHTSDICHIADLHNVVADMLSRPPASLAATCVKVPTESQAAARREDKSNTSPPSLAVVMAAFDGRMDFLTMAGNKLKCPDTITAIRSPVLSLQPV